MELTRAAAAAAAEKRGQDITAFDVSDQLAITDVFLLVSARNERQVGAIVDGIEASLRAHDAKPARREGDRELRWVLLDFLDLVVHVQHVEERSYYALERLWRDCPQLTLDVDDRPPPGPDATVDDQQDGGGGGTDPSDRPQR